MDEESLCEYKHHGVISYVRAEFKCVNFLFPLKNINLFNKCQWPIPVFIFLTYKVFVAIFTTIITIGGPCFVGLRYFVYLTNISYTVTAIYFVSSAIRTVTFEVLRRKRNRHPPSHETTEEDLIQHDAPTNRSVKFTLLKISIYFEWMARHLAYCGALIVTVGFYSFVAKLEGLDGKSLFDVNSHIMNSFIVLIDLFLSASPVKLLHVVWVIFYGVVYGVFTYIYYLLYGIVLYKVLSDWSDPSTAAKYFSLFVFLGALLSNLFIYLCYLLRVALYIRLRKHRISQADGHAVLYTVNA